MKAARYYGPGDVRVEDVEQPLVGPGQVKIKIAWNALSATDVFMFSAPLTSLAPTPSKPNRLTGEKLPITIGHQFSGTIAGLGAGIDTPGWKVGQKVAVAPLLSCMQNTCAQCTTGQRNVCPKATLIGIGGRGGGLAEYVVVDIQNVLHLPSHVSLETGALLEPLAVAYHAVKRSGYKKGQTALVSGAGPVGLLIVKTLRSIDPNSTIVVSEPIESRRKLASRYGATEVVDPTSSQGIALAKVYGATLGAGVDVAFETAGVQSSFNTAFMTVKPHGCLVNVAIWQQSPTVNMNLLNAREIRLTGAMGYVNEYAAVLEDLASGRMPGLEDMITKKIRLGKVVQEGLQPLLANDEAEIKILVQP